MTPKYFCLSLTTVVFFSTAALTVAHAAPEEMQLAQLPMQQTDDPHMKMMLEASVADTSITWETPQGWEETKGTGMRMATFTTGGDNGIECSIIALKGVAGGVEDNIQRWMSQIGLNADESTFNDFISGLPKIQTADGNEAAIADFTTLQDPNQADAHSMIAGILQLESETVFIKMMGTIEAVRENKESFDALVASIASSSAQSDSSYY